MRVCVIPLLGLSFLLLFSSPAASGRKMACADLDNVGNYTHHTRKQGAAFVQQINTIQHSMNHVFAKSQHMCMQGVGHVVFEVFEAFKLLLITRNRSSHPCCLKNLVSFQHSEPA